MTVPTTVIFLTPCGLPHMSDTPRVKDVYTSAPDPDVEANDPFVVDSPPPTGDGESLVAAGVGHHLGPGVDPVVSLKTAFSPKRVPFHDT